MQEVSASLAAAEEISADAAVAAFLHLTKNNNKKKRRWRLFLLDRLEKNAVAHHSSLWSDDAQLIPPLNRC